MMMKKAQWIFGAILAPELVVAMAFGQYLEAKKLRKGLREILQKRAPRDGDPDLVSIINSRNKTVIRNGPNTCGISLCLTSSFAFG
jgi:hypothetical protein